MKSLEIILAAVAIALLTTSAGGAVYMLDPDHSTISLNATHLGIGTVQGHFEKFSGTLEFDPTKVSASKVQVRIDASSISTNHSFRDQHLRSPEFLDVQEYPEILFESTEVTASDRSEFQIAGNLTLHGVTRPVVLQAKFRGAATDMEGKSRIAFAASTRIDRKDFGMAWNRIIGGSPLVGQIVEILLDVEGVEQGTEQAK
ncbi:MAG: polyisoprenoid-binding protein [Candidatus Eisenbacteria bacterium]|nr:polyisoprenoid-binding protein [Candidatus Eisenbacteria bacterium]